MNWPKNLKSKVFKKEPLSRHTTFKIGGPAEFFIGVRDLADLKTIVNLVKIYKVPLRIIGAGSNILAADRGIRGIILNLNQPFFKKINFKGNTAEAGAGCSLPQFIRQCQLRGLTGMEFLAGIPGTIGGALMMNAGVKNSSIADLVENVRAMDYNGTVKDLGRKEIKFGYRSSGLDKYIILDARFRLKSARPLKIKKKIQDNLTKRKVKQDYAYPSAGCVFKNPPQDSAARLIDLCGLKGKSIGAAAVSLKHANFIVNLGQAKAKDVLKLIGLLKKEVKNKFNIELEPEIKIWK
jgi:UDP-N-acetylmuramate dehydrogenase